MKTITIILLVIISLASFGQVETKLRSASSDTDELLQKFVYRNKVIRGGNLIIIFEEQKYDLDSVLVSTTKVQKSLSMQNDSTRNGISIGDINNSIYNALDSTRLKAILLRAVKKHITGK